MHHEGARSWERVPHGNRAGEFWQTDQTSSGSETDGRCSRTVDDAMYCGLIRSVPDWAQLCLVQCGCCRSTRMMRQVVRPWWP